MSRQRVVHRSVRRPGQYRQGPPFRPQLHLVPDNRTVALIACLTSGEPCSPEELREICGLANRDQVYHVVSRAVKHFGLPVSLRYVLDLTADGVDRHEISAWIQRHYGGRGDISTDALRRTPCHR